ncbi:unnamed protein product, partial [Polarella glacialis]
MATMANRKSSVQSYCGPITCFMIRNIPCRLTRQKVQGEFHNEGFEGLYDFFHMPMGGRSQKGLRQRANLGYAFINFAYAEDAARFKATFDQFSFSGTCSEKVCDIVISRVQGLEANLRAHSKHVVPDDVFSVNSYRPFPTEGHLSEISQLSQGSWSSVKQQPTNACQQQ